MAMLEQEPDSTPTGGPSMLPARVTDLTVNEFKDLIREVVTETLVEILRDPDEGLELREDMTIALQRSLATVQAGGETVSAESVAAKLGLEW